MPTDFQAVLSSSKDTVLLTQMLSPILQCGGTAGAVCSGVRGKSEQEPAEDYSESHEQG